MLKILLTKGGQLSFKGEMNMTLKTMRTQESNKLTIHHCQDSLPLLNEENDVDEVHATRTNHNEGIWENIVTLP